MNYLTNLMNYVTNLMNYLTNLMNYVTNLMSAKVHCHLCIVFTQLRERLACQDVPFSALDERLGKLEKVRKTETMRIVS